VTNVIGIITLSKINHISFIQIVNIYDKSLIVESTRGPKYVDPTRAIWHEYSGIAVVLVVLFSSSAPSFIHKKKNIFFRFFCERTRFRITFPMSGLISAGYRLQSVCLDWGLLGADNLYTIYYPSFRKFAL